MATPADISRHEGDPVMDGSPSKVDAAPAHVAGHAEGYALTASQVRMVHQSTTLGIIVCDAEGRILDANPAAGEMLGLGLEAIRGQTVDACHRGLLRDDGSALPPAERPLAATLRTRQPLRDHVLGLLRLDGQRRWLRAETMPVLSDDGAIRQVITTCLDVTQLTEALYHHILHDALTDLPNRTLLHDRLCQAIFAAQRHNSSLALLLLDLDRFKDVNDTLGHHHGDLLLQQLGARLGTVVRSSDTVARLGGDEFAVLLPGANATGAPWVAQKILTALAEPFTLDGQTLEVGASIGIALCPDHGAEAAALLRQADVAMYVAKRTGGGFATYDATRDQHSSNRLAMESELREAIAQDQLTLYYQPQVDVESGRTYAVEALARWPHPQRGLIPPDQFIPLSEHTGLIAPLNRWVLDTALHQCRLWQRAGLDLKVAVNLSMGTVHDPQLPDTVAWLLRRYGIAASRLTLEITESVLMADLTRAVEVLTRLAKLGVHISIDDFGTGYSSLGYLSQLPIHEIKIDKSFVTNMVLNDHDASILSFTIGLGHSLGLRVVAEGVELQETWELLAALGCDTAQGYYLSRPLPVADLEQWLAGSPWGASTVDDAAVAP